jgi:hypothetical protein
VAPHLKEDSVMVILLQSSYFPPIAWFACAAHHKCSIDLAGNYQKQSFRNRTRILGSQGFLELVIPVIHSGKQAISEIKISYRENWVRQHIRSIESVYRNAPYFDYYWPELEPLLQEQQIYLHALNEILIDQLCKMCGLEKPEKEHIWKNYSDCFPDMRERIHPKRNSGVFVRPYIQIFPFNSPDNAGLSILDLLFNKGPETGHYLLQESELPDK